MCSEIAILNVHPLNNQLNDVCGLWASAITKRTYQKLHFCYVSLLSDFWVYLPFKISKICVNINTILYGKKKHDGPFIYLE